MIMLKVLLLLPGLLSAAPEWSVWRGPASEGNYDHETTWKHDWLPTGAKTLWQTTVHTGTMNLHQDLEYLFDIPTQKNYIIV